MDIKDPTAAETVDGWSVTDKTDDTIYYGDGHGHEVGITTRNSHPYQIVLELTEDHPEVEYGFRTVEAETAKSETSAYATAVGMMSVCDRLVENFFEK